MNPTLRGKPGLLVLISAFQATSLASATALFHFHRPTFNLPVAFDQQFYVGVAVVAVIILALPFVSRPSATAFLIAFASFVVFVLGYPLGKHLEIEVFLYLTLCAAGLVLLPGPWNSIASVAITMAAVLLQRPSRSWGTAVAIPAPSEMAMFAGFLVTGWIILFLLSRHIHVQQSKEDEITQLEDTVRRLTSANLGFQSYTATVEEQSRMNERNRITRELHDVVGYTLTNITMMMEEGIDLYKQKDLKELLSLVVTTRDQARTGHAEIRDALTKLRVITPRETQFFHSIRSVTGDFQNATGMKIDIEYTNFPMRVPDEVKSCIFRLIQEGMTNAVSHGKATRATILLSTDEDNLVVAVYDNGVGCAVLQEGLGITGMRERLQQVGGQITFYTSAEGFEFVARVPFDQRPTQALQ